MDQSKGLFLGQAEKLERCSLFPLFRVRTPSSIETLLLTLLVANTLLPWFVRHFAFFRCFHLCASLPCLKHTFCRFITSSPCRSLFRSLSRADDFHKKRQRTLSKLASSAVHLEKSFPTDDQSVHALLGLPAQISELD
ncbi:hypothetical protein T4B_11177 [Trichinella pseudospiralis]|uniref:Uncharacterized protein n=1 Tax=Trichinella pseudospiralis TaxID=6337 RepID=A0A0V1IAA1_TRIPS|nr:hypothetical protein T4B_11177 [Trichinella pseudospiralis]